MMNTALALSAGSHYWEVLEVHDVNRSYDLFRMGDTERTSRERGLRQAVDMENQKVSRMIKVTLCYHVVRQRYD